MRRSKPRALPLGDTPECLFQGRYCERSMLECQPMLSYFKLPFILLFTWSLAACASFHTNPSGPYHAIPFKVRKKHLAQINTWHIEGAFSFHSPTHNAIASYDWQQKPTGYQIHVHSNLDVVAVELVGTPTQVCLYQGDQVTRAASAARLMQQQLGWHLPVANLHYWVRGLPAPGKYRGAQFDHYGHLQRLTQQNWIVEFGHYIHQGAVDLPQTLLIQQQDIHIKIVARWQQ